jgi:hypothetical protein
VQRQVVDEQQRSRWILKLAATPKEELGIEGPAAGRFHESARLTHVFPGITALSVMQQVRDVITDGKGISGCHEGQRQLQRDGIGGKQNR